MEHYKVDLFELLKVKKNLSTNKKYVPQIFFQLNFDKKGGYLRVVDEKNIDIEVVPEYYSGITFQVLSLIRTIKERNNFNIDWVHVSKFSENKVYIAENDFLIDYLLQCDNFINSRFQPIKFSDGSAEVRLIIEGESELKTFFSLYYAENNHFHIFFLSEKYAFTDDSIYKINPIGINFEKIKLFETQFPKIRLEKYLSLVFSNFSNISIDYKGYTQIETEKIYIDPTIIFEKVDAEGSLYVRFTKSVKGELYDFIEDYRVSKVISVNETNKVISISELISKDTESYFDDFEKTLIKYKKQLNDKGNYLLIDNTYIIEEKLAKELIYKELNVLISKFSIIGTENLKDYNIKTVKPKLSLSLNHGIDFLEGDVNLEIEGEIIPLIDVMNNYSKNSYITLKDGTNAIINKSYLDKLKRIFKRDKDKIKISFFDLPIIEELIDEKTSSEIFTKSKEIFLGFNNINDIESELPPVQATLRNYQIQGFKWLKYLYENKLGGCLADDMGLGKTIQTITMLSMIYPQEPISSLVIMPKSLLFNWENEINKFSPELSYYIFYGQNRDMKEARSKNIILTTYAMLRNEIDKFREEEFFYVVLDESQNIKNSSSQISRAVIFLKARYRLGLSGTPIENNLGELYSLFRFLNPSMFGSIDDFNKYYALPIQKENDKSVTEELRKKIYPFVLRRLKRDVLKELPEKIEQTLFVEMSPEQKEFYEQRRLFYYQTVKEQIHTGGIKKSQFYILQALSELRQIASIPEAKSNNEIISPKREVLIENLIDVIANDHKVLVFANFLNTVSLISEDLEKEGIKHLIMTGATKDRQELVDKFQNDSSYKVFLMTLKTGGLGLNLTAADYIFIFDPWWNKSAENQAVDRAYRIGQDKTVFSYKLITKGTIEEKILQLQNKKIELFDSIISSDGVTIKTLDESDVDFILGS